MNQAVNLQDVQAGQAVYTRPMLAVYDLAVLGLFCRFVWRCPSSRILEMYDQHISADHLDLGVGTGYFLDRCRLPSAHPRLILCDLNANSLSVAARRLARLNPTVHRASVLDPITIDGGKFDSVAATCLLHCLPGTMRTKAVMFDHVKAVLKPGGVFFGSTLIGKGIEPPWIARRLMKFFNARKVFTNQQDDLDTLREELAKRFTGTHVERVGCVALFTARK